MMGEETSTPSEPKSPYKLQQSSPYAHSPQPSPSSWWAFGPTSPSPLGRMSKHLSSAPTTPAKLLALPVSENSTQHDGEHQQESATNGSSSSSPFESEPEDDFDALSRVDSPLCYKYARSPVLTPVLEQVEDELDVKEEVPAELDATRNTLIDANESVSSPLTASEPVASSLISSFNTSLLDDDDDLPHTPRLNLIEPLEISPRQLNGAGLVEDDLSDDESSNDDFCHHNEDEQKKSNTHDVFTSSSPLLRQQQEIARALKLNTLVPQCEKDDTPLTAIRIDEKTQNDNRFEEPTVASHTTDKLSDTSEAQDPNDSSSQISPSTPTNNSERPGLSLHVQDLPLIEELRFGAQPALTPTNKSWILTSPTSTENQYLNLLDDGPRTPATFGGDSPGFVHGHGSTVGNAQNDFLSPASSSGRSMHEIMDTYATMRATRPLTYYFQPIFSPMAGSPIEDGVLPAQTRNDECETQDTSVTLPSPAGWWCHTLTPTWMPSTAVLDSLNSTAVGLKSDSKSLMLPGPAGWWLRTLTPPWMPSADVLMQKCKPWKLPRPKKHKKREPRYDPGSWSNPRMQVRRPPTGAQNAEQQAAASKWKALANNIDDHDAKMCQTAQDELAKKRANGEVPEKDAPMTYNETFKKTVAGDEPGQRHIVSVTKTTHSAGEHMQAVPSVPHPTPVNGPLHYDPWPAGMEQALLSRITSRGTSPVPTNFVLDDCQQDAQTSSPLNATTSSSPNITRNDTAATTPSPKMIKSFRGRRGVAPSALVVDRAAAFESESGEGDDDSGMWAQESPGGSSADGTTDEDIPLLGHATDFDHVLKEILAVLTHPLVYLLALWTSLADKIGNGYHNLRVAFSAPAAPDPFHDENSELAALLQRVSDVLQELRERRADAEGANGGAPGGEQSKVGGRGQTDERGDKTGGDVAGEPHEAEEELGEEWWI